MLQDVVDEYLNSLSVQAMQLGGTTGTSANQNTLVAYRNDLSQACVYFARQQIQQWQEVTREQVATYLLEMREKQDYRPTTIARKLAALKAFFRYLRATDQLAANPLESIESPRVRKSPPQTLTQEQVADLFRQVDVSTAVGQRDFAMLHMLYATGMRVSE